MEARTEKQNTSDTPESQEARPALNAVIEHAIQEGKEVGAGKDGIVFRVEFGGLSQEEQEILVAERIIGNSEDTDPLAAKILKIYDAKVGVHEFTMQQQAREILSGFEGTARVPNASAVRDQEISKVTRENLNRRGAQLEDKAEIILMDYIEGKDLGTIMYDFVLQQLEYDDDYIDSLTFSVKEQLVGEVLQFVQPDPQASTPEQRASAQAIAFDKNEQKLLKYLKWKEFRLDPAIIAKVEESVRLLQQHGIYHNDLHKRNIMIGSDGEVYVIDFGRADNSKRKDGTEDTVFAQRWKALTFSAKEEQERKYQSEREELNRIEARLQSHPRQKERVAQFISTVQEQGTISLEQEFGRSRQSDSQFEQFLIMLHIAKESEKLSSDRKKEIDDFVDRMLAEKTLRLYQQNRLRFLVRVEYLEQPKDRIREQFKEFYQYATEAFPEGLFGEEHAFKISLDGRPLLVMLGGVEGNVYQVLIFLEQEKYARKTLQIDSQGNISEETGRVIPDIDLTADEPDFSHYSNEELALKIINEIQHSSLERAVN